MIMDGNHIVKMDIIGFHYSIELKKKIIEQHKDKKKHLSLSEVDERLYWDALQVIMMQNEREREKEANNPSHCWPGSVEKEFDIISQ